MDQCCTTPWCPKRRWVVQILPFSTVSPWPQNRLNVKHGLGMMREMDKVKQYQLGVFRWSLVGKIDESGQTRSAWLDHNADFGPEGLWESRDMFSEAVGNIPEAWVQYLNYIKGKMIMLSCHWLVKYWTSNCRISVGAFRFTLATSLYQAKTEIEGTTFWPQWQPTTASSCTPG